MSVTQLNLNRLTIYANQPFFTILVYQQQHLNEFFINIHNEFYKVNIYIVSLRAYETYL